MKILTKEQLVEVGNIFKLNYADMDEGVTVEQAIKAIHGVELSEYDDDSQKEIRECWEDAVFTFKLQQGVVRDLRTLIRDMDSQIMLLTIKLSKMDPPVSKAYESAEYEEIWRGGVGFLQP
jgi:hypothetical protein